MHLVDYRYRPPDRRRFLSHDTSFGYPFLDDFPNRFPVVPAPDDLIEVSLKMLSTKVVVDAHEGALHL